MSRVANSPVALPKGVDIKIEGMNLSVKGGKGTLDLTLTDGVGVNVEEDVATITYDCLLYTSPSPRDATLSRMPSSA